MTRLERRLLKHGTFSGPVTPETIALAKDMYEKVCKKLNHEMRKEGWEDFLIPAKEQLDTKNNP